MWDISFCGGQQFDHLTKKFRIMILMKMTTVTPNFVALGNNNEYLIIQITQPLESWFIVLCGELLLKAS